MAQVINTNVAALFAGAALNKSAIGLQVAQERPRPACASTAPRTTPPVWRFLSA